MQISLSAEGEDNMNTKDKIKKIIAIIFSIFIGVFLITVLNRLFPAAVSGILPSNENIRSFVIELIRTIISIGLLFLFHKTSPLRFSFLTVYPIFSASTSHKCNSSFNSFFVMIESSKTFYLFVNSFFYTHII